MVNKTILVSPLNEGNLREIKIQQDDVFVTYDAPEVSI